MSLLFLLSSISKSLIIKILNLGNEIYLDSIKKTQWRILGEDTGDPSPPP